MDNYVYAALLAFSLAYPLGASFEKRVQYYKNFRYLFPAIGIAAAIFILWDIWFTATGIWSFNHQYTMGLYVAGLPIEEWLFFIVIPFACLFIYEVLDYFFKNRINFQTRYLNLALGVVFVVIAAFNTHRTYTAVNFAATGALLLFFYFRIKNAAYMPRFYVAYLISLLPFLLVNGILTHLPVVSYNDTQNLGIRIFSIPVEDAVYLLFLLLLTTGIYEKLKNRK